MTAALRLARRYFRLSNAGDLAAIKELFTQSSTYSSANTGIYLGADQIIAMQAHFCKSFATMEWEIHRVEEVKPGIVFVEFTFCGKTLDGEIVLRPGEEYVVVHKGKLQHVEVRNKVVTRS